MAKSQLTARSAQGGRSPFLSTFLLLTVAVVLLIGGSSVFIYLSVKEIEKEVSLLHLEIARRAQSVILGSIQNNIQDGENVASEIAFQKSETIPDSLSLFLKESQPFERASFIDAAGKEIIRVDKFAVVTPADLKDLKNDSGFQEALSTKKTSVGSVFFSNRLEPLLPIVVPVESIPGEFRGAIKAEMNLRFMWNLTASIQVGTRGKVYVVDNFGNLVADPDSSLVLGGENLSKRSPVKKLLDGAPLVDGLSSDDHYINSDGVDIVVSGIRIEPYGWAVLVEEPSADALLPATQARNAGIGLSAASAILLALLLFLIVRLTRLNRSLDQERAHSAAVISNLADGIIEYSPDLHITNLNPEAERLLGVSLGEVKGRFLHDAEFTRNPKLQSLAGMFRNENGKQTPSSTGSEEFTAQEVAISYPIERTLQVITIPILGYENTPTSFVKLLRDVTREKLLNKLKSEFISIAAHQLRTPLSALKWVFRSFLDGDMGPINQEQIEFLNKGYTTNERMIRLVGSLLNVSRIEEGRFGYQFEKGDFISFMKDILSNADTRIKSKDLELVFQAPKEGPPSFFDKEKLSLAVDNLLDNAINYTPAGGRISVSITREGDYLEATIQDTGVGIPKEQMSRLFTKFFRADNVVRLQAAGSGLGLFLAKSIVEAHGGSIHIASEEGKGTTVVFTVPLKEALIPAQKEGTVAL